MRLLLVPERNGGVIVARRLGSLCNSGQHPITWFAARSNDSDENLRNIHLYPEGFYFPAGGASIHHLAAAGSHVRPLTRDGFGYRTRGECYLACNPGVVAVTGSRALLEATAYAVRHNFGVMTDAGDSIGHIVAVGGGSRSSLWPQIVADVTGLDQHLPQEMIGASYGDAWLAATAAEALESNNWNPAAASASIWSSDRFRGTS